jgi:mono/diheme cytochrome c family protein
MSGMAKRISLTFLVVVVILAVGLLFTYQIIPLDWISFMEIQPSFRPMEDPLPVPARSVPVEGAAFVPGAGSPVNPVPSSPDSLARGQSFYAINCALCHGNQGKGDGPIAKDLIRKPSDLTGVNVAPLSDGEIFQVITSGVQPPAGTKGGMPALRENLTVNDRWDVVNYVRSLQGQ